MKIDFFNVIFTDECPVTLDGPDGRGKVLIIFDEDMPVAKRNRQ